LDALPRELLEHALTFLAAADLAHATCSCRLLRGATAARALQVAALVQEFPCLPAILRAASERGDRLPSDFESLRCEQTAVDTERITPLAHQPEPGVSFSDELLLTLELFYCGKREASWCGTPSAVCPSLHAAAVDDAQFPRMWAERPAWIDALNALNQTDPLSAARGWSNMTLRVLVSRGLRTLKVYEADNVDGDGKVWSYFDYNELCTAFSSGAPRHAPPEHGQRVLCSAHLSDDGVVKLLLELEPDEHDEPDSPSPMTADDAAHLLCRHLPW